MNEVTEYGAKMLANDGEKMTRTILRAMKRVLRDGPESAERHAAHLARNIANSLTFDGIVKSDSEVLGRD